MATYQYQWQHLLLQLELVLLSRLVFRGFFVFRFRLHFRLDRFLGLCLRWIRYAGGELLLVLASLLALLRFIVGDLLVAAAVYHNLAHF